MAGTLLSGQIFRPVLAPVFRWHRGARSQQLRSQAAMGDIEAYMQPQPDLQRMMDGPDLSLMSYPNLGQIAGMLHKDQSLPPSEAQAMLEVPSRHFTGGLYFDGFAVFGSLVLFSLMIALSFGRVLGVDQYVTRTLKTWREEKRERERCEVIEAREKLEKMYEEEQ